MPDEPGPSTTRYRKLTEAQITSISGAVSGFTATVAKQPVQRLKWIRQVDAGPAVPYNQVLQRQLAADGFFGLFRGSTAAIARNVPHSALVYSFFPFFERLVAQQLATPGGEPPKGSFATRFWAGYATLFAATLFTSCFIIMHDGLSYLFVNAGVEPDDCLGSSNGTFGNGTSVTGSS